MNWYKFDRKNWKQYFELVIASIIYVVPIILADRYYFDDLARSLYGATGWRGDGRPLGEYLVLLLCDGKPIVDISPLPLILSIAILSYSLVLYCKNNLDLIADEHAQVLVLLFIITNPFAMSNLSYKFDCIIMLVSLSISFLIYSIHDEIPWYWLFGGSIISGVLIMSLYQAAIGMCIALFIINVLFYIIKKNSIIQDVVRILGIGVGILAYKIVIAPHFIARDDWRYKASKSVQDISLQSLKVIADNIVNSCDYIIDNMLRTPLLFQVAGGITIICSILSILILYLRRNSERKVHRKIAEIIFIIISPVFVWLATFLPLMVLSSLHLKSRIFLAFGGFFFYIAIMLMISSQKRKRFATVLLLLCLFCQYTYMYTYGNALKNQKEYEKYAVYNIAHDLETINCDGQFRTVSFVGDMPRSRQVQMICEKYPLFEEIIPVYFSNDTWIGGAWVYHYLQYDLKIEEITEEDREVVDFSEPVINNSIYACYINTEKIIVCFR